MCTVLLCVGLLDFFSVALYSGLGLKVQYKANLYQVPLNKLSNMMRLLLKLTKWIESTSPAVKQFNTSLSSDVKADLANGLTSVRNKVLPMRKILMLEIFVVGMWRGGCVWWVDFWDGVFVCEWGDLCAVGEYDEGRGVCQRFGGNQIWFMISQDTIFGHASLTFSVSQYLFYSLQLKYLYSHNFYIFQALLRMVTFTWDSWYSGWSPPLSGRMWTTATPLMAISSYVTRISIFVD